MSANPYSMQQYLILKNHEFVLKLFVFSHVRLVFCLYFSHMTKIAQS